MLGTTVKGWPLGDIFLCHLGLPGFSLRLKPVLIRFAVAQPSLLIKFIGPRGNLRCKIDRDLG